MFKCPACNKNTKKLSGLKYHYYRSHGFYCYVCKKKYKHLLKHTIAKHNHNSLLIYLSVIPRSRIRSSYIKSIIKNSINNLIKSVHKYSYV